MESFETFFEKHIQSLPFTQGTIAYSTGIFIPDQYWTNFLRFPAVFKDKMSVTAIDLKDQRKIEVNKELMEKCFSLASAFIGYGTRSNGYRLAKTKIICDYSGLNMYEVITANGDNIEDQEVFEVQAASEEAAKAAVMSKYTKIIRIRGISDAMAQHTHYRKRSWSHNIELFMHKMDGDFDELMGYIVHEMIHAKQTTTRRLSTSSKDGRFKWDGKVIDSPEDFVSPEADAQYRSTPWEVEAYSRTPEIVGQIRSFLTSGVAKGFNPHQV